MLQVFDWARIVFSVLLIIAVTLPLVRNDYWVFRILEYPRFQKLMLCCFGLLLWALWPPEHTVTLAVCALLWLCTVYLLYKIFPYTPFSRREMKNATPHRAEKQLSIFAANIYEKNRDYDRVLLQINTTDPDIVFLVETDAAWLQGVKSLEQHYPHRLYKPLPNTYGLLFFSRLPLREKSLNFLVEDDVPSVEVVAELPSGDQVRIWGLHPKPPVPGEDITTTAKDKELLLVAEKAGRSELPVIVMGDLNDVAWSYTTELFRKTSRLLDPRRGRGFYSTFNANNSFMRFPLDYIFCSNDFGLIRMKRMPKNGSDHFAMFISLYYDPSLKAVQKRPKAGAKEIQEADDKKSEKTD